MTNCLFAFLQRMGVTAKRVFIVMVVVCSLFLGMYTSGGEYVRMVMQSVFKDGSTVQAVGGYYFINGHPIYASENQNIIFVKYASKPSLPLVAVDDDRYEPMCYNEIQRGHQLPTTTTPAPTLNESPLPSSPSSPNVTHSTIYNTSGDQYVWMRTRVGARGSWATELISTMKQEFPPDEGPHLDAAIPLLQPLWGTLEVFTVAGLTRPVLSGPPPLPIPTRECVNGSSTIVPLIILPARWVQRPPTREAKDESGMPILAVPPTVPVNVLSMAAQALELTGALAGATPTFRVPIFSTGGMMSVVTDMVKAGNTTGEPWGLLGLSSGTEAANIFRAALIGDSASTLTELKIASPARVVRVRPTCGEVDYDCNWCDEVTIAVPLQLRAGVAGRVLQMAVWVSVTEIVCGDGGAAPHVADSLAAAVHLGVLMGAEDGGATHVVVLGEDHVVHTLAQRGGDRQFFHDKILGGSTTESGVGHAFLEQMLGAWSDGSERCRGPHAVQAIVLGLDTTEDSQERTSNNATSTAALDTNLRNLAVDHHGVMFEGKTVVVPSWPMTTSEVVLKDGDNCRKGHSCLRMHDIVNSIFHPYTTLEGVVSVRRRHQLPMKTRKVLGIVDPAEVRDVLKEKLAATGNQAVEAIDGVSPLAVCVRASSFALVNGLYGRDGGRWVATVEDVAGALRSRFMPLMMQHRYRVDCAAGGGGVVGAALRVLRVVTRHVVGHGASHTGGEETVVGWRLSSGLRDLSLSTPHRQATPTPTEEDIERPTLAQFVIRRSPLVAACARVVRMPAGVSVTREITAIDETTLWLQLTPRVVHMGDARGDVRGFDDPAEGADPEHTQLALSKRVSRALYRLVAGVPTSMCVPDGLLHVLQAHTNAMIGHRGRFVRISLEERLRREFSPWRHAQCSGGEDVAMCVVRAQLRHMQQMLECDSMGEWLRRVSDDMRILMQPNMSTTQDSTESFGEDAMTPETAFGDALCHRWRCNWITTTPRPILGGRPAGYILKRKEHNSTAEVPGADADVTRTMGVGDLSHIKLQNGSMMVTFIRNVLASPLLDETSASTMSIGHTLQARSVLCSGPNACLPFPVTATSHIIEGPLTLWQQWALRYVRMLIHTMKTPPTVVTSPIPNLNTASNTTTPAPTQGEQSLVRAQSGHGRLYNGDWSAFAWGSLRARTKLSLDFALSRFMPGGSPSGSSPGRAALSHLVTAQTAEDAYTHMETALLYLTTTELTLLLRRPLLKEALAAAEVKCGNESRQVVASPMPIARAVVQHLRPQSWDMGPDSVVDFVVRTRDTWIDCAVRGLRWLERKWEGAGVSESELYVWLNDNSTVHNSTTAYNYLSFLFARELQCLLPPLPTANNNTHHDADVHPKTLSSRAVDAAYTFLQSIVRQAAFDLLDSSSSLELLFKTTTQKVSFCAPLSPSSTGADQIGHDLSFDRSALHYHIPCFRCCGFMTEMKAYFPPMIEDKGLPLSISYQMEDCMCNMDSADSSHPQDVFRRSLLVQCDNKCHPTTYLPPGSDKFIRETAEDIYFKARQRHYRGHEPPTDGSNMERSSAIWMDHTLPLVLYKSTDAVNPFLQVDSTPYDDRVSWGRRVSWGKRRKNKDVATPLDRALSRNLFTAYNDQGQIVQAPTPISTPFNTSNISADASDNDSPPSWLSIQTSTSGYRICRSMYEADRLSQDWSTLLAYQCDEIWTPSNWGKSMFINTFVTPHLELAFVPRVMDKNVSSASECIGCVPLSSSESSFLLPPTTAYKPVSINVDALRLRTNLKLKDKENTIGHIQQKVASDRRKNALLRQFIEGFPFQVIAMLRKSTPVLRWYVNREACIKEVVNAINKYSVHVERLYTNASEHTQSPSFCKTPTSCRPALVIGIGNRTHQLAYRVRLTSTFDLTNLVAMPESADINNMDPAIVSPIDVVPQPIRSVRSTIATPTTTTTTTASVITNAFDSSNNSTNTDINNLSINNLTDEHSFTATTGIPIPHEVPASARPGLFQPGDKTHRWERWCSRKCFRGPPGDRRFISREESFRFLSVFKWQPRKGWSELMEAFYRAFYAPLYTNRTNEKEPMLIVVGKAYRPPSTFLPVHFSTKLVEEWFQKSGLPVVAPGNPSLGRADFPCMCFVTQSLGDDDLVSLFRSVDAFTLLTRGEGWGLPISEAMAMGLPTISTHWGGTTEFNSRGSIPVAVNTAHHEPPSSYTVNATTFESPDEGDGYEANMRMAAPSIPHTVRLLRQVYEQSPEENQEAGQRAREVIVRGFSEAATTDLMAVRLAVVAQKLRWESDEEVDTRKAEKKIHLKQLLTRRAP